MSEGNQFWRLGSRLDPVPGLSGWGISKIFANSLYKRVGVASKVVEARSGWWAEAQGHT